MGFFIYLFIAIIVAFFAWKHYEPIIKEEIKNSSVYSKSIVEQYSFWIMTAFVVCWPFSLPIIGLWKLLDIIYNKFNKNNNEEL